MKKLSLFLVLIFLGMSLYSCLPNKTNDEEDPGNTDTTDTGNPNDPNAVLIDTVIVTGDVEVGEPLTAKVEMVDQNLHALTPSTFQWYRDGEPIDGAVTSVYFVKEEDIGKEITVGVSPHTWDDALTEGPEVISAVMVIPPNVAPAPDSVWISGEPYRGETVTARYLLSDTAGSPKPSYQWFIDGEAIEGENSSTYTLVAGDSARTLGLEVYIDLEEFPSADSGVGDDSIEVYGQFVKLLGGVPLALDEGYAPSDFHMHVHRGELILVFFNFEGDDDANTVRETWVINQDTIKRVDAKPMPNHFAFKGNVDYLKEENGNLYMVGGSTDLQGNGEGGIYTYSSIGSWDLVTESEEMRKTRNVGGHPNGLDSIPFQTYLSDTGETNNDEDTTASMDIPGPARKDYWFAESYFRIYHQVGVGYEDLFNAYDVFHFSGGMWVHKRRFDQGTRSLKTHDGWAACYHQDHQTNVVTFYGNGGDTDFLEVTSFSVSQYFDFHLYKGKYYFSEHEGNLTGGNHTFEIYNDRDLFGGQLANRPQFDIHYTYHIGAEPPHNVYVFNQPRDSLVPETDPNVIGEWRALFNNYVMKSTSTGWELIGQPLASIYAMAEYEGDVYIISHLRNYDEYWELLNVDRPYYLAKYYPFTKP